MKINWTVRVKNKFFWLAAIPAVLLLAQQICGMFGLVLDIAWISEQLRDIVNTVFILLALLGVVNDPTTAGTSDSANAMTYVQPKAAEDKEI